MSRFVYPVSSALQSQTEQGQAVQTSEAINKEGQTDKYTRQKFRYRPLYMQKNVFSNVRRPISDLKLIKYEKKLGF